MKRIQTEISTLRMQLKDKKAADDFAACDKISQRVIDLKVNFSKQVILWGGTTVSLAPAHLTVHI